MPYGADRPQTEEVRKASGQVVRTQRQVVQSIPRRVQIRATGIWGIDRLRHETSTSNSGSVTHDSNRGIKLSTGTNSNGSATLRTRNRGQYRAGTWAEPGMRVVFDSLPTGSQEVEWGFFDGTNGQIFGHDSTGPYVARYEGGSRDSSGKIRQADWNRDTLDGSDDRNNPTGLTYDPTNGVVYNPEHSFYGQGPNRWYIDVLDTNNNQRERVLVHEEIYPGEPNLRDPNQPVRIKVDNGGSTTSDFVAFVSDMQYSLLGDGGAVSTRPIPITISEHTINTSEENWEPLLAVRRKENFAGRTNSTRAIISGFNITADNIVEARVTFDDSVSNLTWADPDDWDASESPVERKRQNDAGDLSSTAGLRILSGGAGADKNQSASASDKERVALGSTTEAVLWARKMTTNTTVVQYAELTMEAQL